MLAQAHCVAVPIPTDVDDLGQGGDCGSVAFSQSEIIMVETVLGSDVAADVVLADKRASTLWHAELVDLCWSVVATVTLAVEVASACTDRSVGTLGRFDGCARKKRRWSAITY